MVVYDTVDRPTPANGDWEAAYPKDPKFGYAFSTVEDKTLTTSHTVIVTGLDPNKKYYFRTVSRASPVALSGQISGRTMATSTGSPSGNSTGSPSGSTNGIGNNNTDISSPICGIQDDLYNPTIHIGSFRFLLKDNVQGTVGEFNEKFYLKSDILDLSINSSNGIGRPRTTFRQNGTKIILNEYADLASYVNRGRQLQQSLQYISGEENNPYKIYGKEGSKGLSIDDTEQINGLIFTYSYTPKNSKDLNTFYWILNT